MLTPRQCQLVGAAMACFQKHGKKFIASTALSQKGMTPPTDEEVEELISSIAETMRLINASIDVFENASPNETGGVNVPGHTFRALYKALGSPDLPELEKDKLFCRTIQEVLDAKQPGEEENDGQSRTRPERGRRHRRRW